MVYSIYIRFDILGFAINSCELPVKGVLKVTEQRLCSEKGETQLYLQLAPSRELQWGGQQFLQLSSIVFNVYWVINGVVFPWNVSIILIKQPYNTGITIIWHLDLYISSHALNTFWQFRYMKNTTTTITILHPRHTVPKPLVCSVHRRSDCFPLNSRVPNSAL